MKKLMVFGHPAHELALFGMIQRDRPDILIITDGGGPKREADSRVGLATIGMTARYLSYPEADFYKALLARDAAYFSHVAAAVREVIDEIQPDVICCDAVEFYNPVHDVTVPIVRAALGPGHKVELFEVPLVYEEEGPGEVYHIQRVPPAFADRRVAYDLTPEQLDKKESARNAIYTNLRDQAGPEFMQLSREHLGHEEIFRSSVGPVEPGQGRKLRYEWRAQLLQSQGSISEVITYAGHYVPAMAALCESPAALSGERG